MTRVLPSHHRIAHANSLGLKVNVLPSQAYQLGLAQAGEGRGEDQHAEHRTEYVRRRRRAGPGPASSARGGRRRDSLVRDRAKDKVELVRVEELQVRVDVALMRLDR
jgi:hypothetical protein